jgi:HSP20 family protein
MTMPPRNGPGSVSRRLSERARQAPAEQAAPDNATGDIFGRLRQMVDHITQAVSAASAANGAQATETGKQASVVFGYNLSMGLDGLKMEPFGDVAAQAGRKRPDAKSPQAASRAPIVDVFDNDGVVTVIAELPGVAEADITCKLDGTQLHIATSGAHRYAKTVTLPGGLDAATLTRSCRNGILDVRIVRKAAP